MSKEAIETPINTFQQGYIPKKKNIAFETIKNIAAFVGGSAILAATGSFLYNSWKAKSIKPANPKVVLEALNLPMGFAMGVGALTIWKTSEYNNKIDELTKTDGFAERVKQDRTVKTGSPSSPSR
jgi:hypothetical protein